MLTESEPAPAAPRAIQASRLPPADEPALLHDWWSRTRESQWAHYESDKALMRTHYWIGIPLVLLTAFSGTSVFYAISTEHSRYLDFIVAATSVVAAILGGLQTFLRLPEQAATHREAAVSYSVLRRAIEERISEAEPRGPGNLSALRSQIDSIAERSPSIPSRAWRRVERKLGDRQ